MPSGRIKKSDATKREEFMLAIFKKEPDLSILKANTKLKAEFGTMMRAQRAYELRTIARKAAKAGINTGTAPVQAARRANANKPTEAGRAVNHTVATSGERRLVIIEGSKEKIEFLDTTLGALRDAGLAVPVIDHRSESYAVIKAPKD